MQMIDKNLKNELYNRKNIIIFFMVMIVFCFGCFVFLIRSSSRESQKAGLEMDRLYLRELTTQTIGHFQTSLKSQLSQLSTSAASIHEEDLQSADTLETYLARTQEYNEFSFFALLDEEGKYYSADGVYPAASKISFLAELLRGEKNLVSYNETILGNDMILIGEPITPVDYGDKKLVAVLAGLDVNAINNQLSLKKEDAKTYTSIIDKSGRFIINNSYDTDPSRGTNFISKMQKYAEFMQGYSLGGVVSDLESDRSGLAAYTIDGQNQYLYYAAISGTDWFLLTIIPYEIVNATISDLISSLTRNSIIMMLCILILLSGIFVFYAVGMDRKEQGLKKAMLAAEELRKQAEDASYAKSEFLSRMSHEIRTPMNGIIGMTAIARQNTDNPAKVEDCLKKVWNSSQHLLTLINDILDMSKIESGKIELRSEIFDFKDFLDNLGNMYYSQAKSRGIEYETVLAGDIQENLTGDSLRLNQILSNLLSNALKFTPSGGTVRLRIAKTEEKKDSIILRFEVSDTGRGIEEKNFDKIFESFEQENAGITSRYGGTGLGLSIVRRFSELMGGKVWVESRIGKGSTFIAELPFPKYAHREDIPQFCGLRVLVVDDNRENCEHTAGILKEMGIQTEWADSGAKAVRCAEAAESRGEPYDVCFIDWEMPSMNGLETAKGVRDVMGDHAGTFVMTSYESSELERQAAEAGITHIVLKPLFPSSAAKILADITHRQVSGAAANRNDGYEFRGRRILLAEDNDLNREIAVELMKAVKAEVDETVNGKEAVEMFGSSPPGYYDLILMDIQMPVMDGRKAAGIIREMDRQDAADIPIFAMSANAFAEDEEESRLAGMDVHISKPIDVKTLYAKMDFFFSKNGKQI